MFLWWLQVLTVEGCDEASLSKAIDEIKVPCYPIPFHILRHTTVSQSMYMDVPDGIVQEPLDAEMSCSNAWKGKFWFPTRHGDRSHQCSSGGGGGGSSSSSSLNPLFQNLDTPLPRLIERIDGVRLRNHEGVGEIKTADFSRTDMPLNAFEYFAVMRGEHGARCVRVSLECVAGAAG